MSRIRSFVLIGAFLTSATPSLATKEVPLPEDQWRNSCVVYSVDPTLEFVRVENFYIRDAVVSQKLDKGEFGTRGVFTDGSKTKVYNKIARVGKHVFTTNVKVNPARGGGFGGAFPTWHLTISLDNKKRVDCDFAHVHYLDMTFKDIRVSTDGSVYVTVLKEGAETTHYELFEDKAVVTDDRIWKRFADT